MLLIFSIDGFAQKPNSSASERKKAGVKEMHFYTENETIPATVLHYDKEGRMTKIVSYDNQSYESEWRAESSTYDSKGRLTGVQIQYGDGDRLENMKYKPAWRSTKFTYTGDTMSFQIDSIWETPVELSVTYTTRVIHWTKHPAPFPRPIFWQDSLCKKTFSGKKYEILFEKAGEAKIDKIDSAMFFQNTASFIQNGKLYHVMRSNDSYDKTIEYVESIDVFTLHDKFDTVIENHQIKHFPEALAANPALKDYVRPTDISYYETIRNNKQIIEWVIETDIYNGKPFVFEKKRLENMFGFPKEDNSLTQYYEAWDYNSGDVEALTITYYKKYVTGKVSKKIIHW